MSDLKTLINREIKAARQQLRGKIMSDPYQADFDALALTEPTWLADVDVGADRLLIAVPIKINGPKARFYARLGSPVFLQTDAQGRWQIIGPADRAREQGNLILLDEDTEVATPSGNVGFTLVVPPFEFYEGTGVPGGGLWNNLLDSFPKRQRFDADGNEV